MYVSMNNKQSTIYTKANHSSFEEITQIKYAEETNKKNRIDFGCRVL